MKLALRAIMSTGIGLSSLGLLSLSFTAESAQAATFTVDAALNSASGGVGLNTDLFFEAGDSLQVTVDVDDLWSAGSLPRWSNADGLDGDFFATGTDESGRPAGTKIGRSFGSLVRNGLSAPFGSLVGEIAGNYFFLGTDFDGTAPETGILNLYDWDINTRDNSGQVSVTVAETKTTPEPTSAVAFLAVGAMAMGFARRK